MIKPLKDSEILPCKFCKHYKEVRWSHRSFGCSLANTRSTSDGYGPFYVSPQCIFDHNAPKMESRFEPISEAENVTKTEHIRNLKETNRKLENDIENLKESIIKLSTKNQHN